MRTVCILLAFTLGACTSEDSLFQGQAELPSQTPTTTLVSQTNSQGLLLNCNEFEETSVALSGRIKIYEDPLSGYQDDRVSVRLDSLPTHWETNSNLQIRFYRWRTSPSGEVSQDSEPLAFYIRDPNTAQNISGSYTSLDHSDFFSLLGRNDARALLQHNLIVMVGTPDEGYHVIRPVLYNVQLDETVGFVDALIPAFVADPNLYAQTHHDLINSIHPFWSKKNEGWSENNYVAFGEAFCF